MCLELFWSCNVFKCTCGAPVILAFVPTFLARSVSASISIVARFYYQNSLFISWQLFCCFLLLLVFLCVTKTNEQLRWASFAVHQSSVCICLVVSNSLNKMSVPLLNVAGKEGRWVGTVDQNTFVLWSDFIVGDLELNKQFSDLCCFLLNIRCQENRFNWQLSI